MRLQLVNVLHRKLAHNVSGVAVLEQLSNRQLYVVGGLVHIYHGNDEARHIHLPLLVRGRNTNRKISSAVAEQSAIHVNLAVLEPEAALSAVGEVERVRVAHIRVHHAQGAHAKSNRSFLRNVHKGRDNVRRRLVAVEHSKDNVLLVKPQALIGHAHPQCERRQRLKVEWQDHAHLVFNHRHGNAPPARRRQRKRLRGIGINNVKVAECGSDGECLWNRRVELGLDVGGGLVEVLHRHGDQAADSKASAVAIHSSHLENARLVVCRQLLVVEGLVCVEIESLWSACHDKHLARRECCGLRVVDCDGMHLVEVLVGH
eukprot:Opistho-2@75779